MIQMLTFEFVKNGKILNKRIKIPDLCPKCGEKLQHVNALDTKAHCYMVWCNNLDCRFVQDYYYIEDMKEVIFKCR